MKKSINYVIVILILLIFVILSILIIKDKNARNNKNIDIRNLMYEFAENKNYKVTSTLQNDTKKIVKEFYRKDEKVKFSTISEEDSTIDEFMQYDPDLVERMKKQQDDRIHTSVYYDDNYKYELCSTLKTGTSWINFHNENYVVYFEDVIEDLKKDTTIVEEQEDEKVQSKDCKKLKISTEEKEYCIWIDKSTGAILKKEEQNTSADESTIQTTEYIVEYNVVKDEDITLPNIDDYSITDKI